MAYDSIKLLESKMRNVTRDNFGQRNFGIDVKRSAGFVRFRFGAPFTRGLHQHLDTLNRHEKIIFFLNRKKKLYIDKGSVNTCQLTIEE